MKIQKQGHTHDTAFVPRTARARENRVRDSCVADLVSGERNVSVNVERHNNLNINNHRYVMFLNTSTDMVHED